MQLSSKSGEDEGLETLLDSITSQTCPSGQHTAYHAKRLELLVRRLESQPARLGVKYASQLLELLVIPTLSIILAPTCLLPASPLALPCPLTGPLAFA